MNINQFTLSSDDHKSVQIWGNTLVNFSGRGPTAECIVKPDIIAPGADIVSCMSLDYGLKHGRAWDMPVSAGYIKMSGTSMSTPVVAGAVALLLEKHPRLQPNDVKYLLKKSAVNLYYPKNQQGWGALDIEALLKYGGQYERQLYGDF